MDYQDRIVILMKALKDYLRQIEAPKHLDDQAMLGELKRIAETVNKLISASLNQDAFKHRVECIFQHLDATYKGRTWPTPSHFADAAQAMAGKNSIENLINSGAGVAEVGSAEWSLWVHADRIREGKDKISDAFLYGTMCLKMMDKCGVTEGELRPYRSALYFAFKDTYGQEKAQAMEAELIARHELMKADFAAAK